VGVVFDDADADAFYDPGEGRGTVRIRIGGHVWQAITSPSGGYAFPIAGAPTHIDGYVQVFADSGIFGATLVEKRFYPTGNNVKLDFLAEDLVDSDLPPDGLPDYWESFYIVTDAASDSDGDGYSALEEYRFGSDPTRAISTPLNPLGTPTSTGSTPDEGPEGCGALGLEVLLLLGLRRLFRR
jgi:MYXO-CTERM domain-containing protein